jgi:anti-sigma regulatory factor (Ser/Thr protein kinase)
LDACFKLELESNPELLCVVRGAVQQLAAVTGFNDDDCRVIVLAVDEALTNVIRHAYANRHDQKIEIRCCLLDQDAGIEFVVTDYGAPGDPEKMKSRDLDDVRPGGLGLHLIAQIMDTVQYEALPATAGRPGTNRLRLVKYRKTREAERSAAADKPAAASDAEPSPESR